MIYQEGNWPKEYQNQLYTLSIHGKRLQREKIDYDGPVAIARHQPDVLKVKDGWFMGVQAKAGPDGGVYMIDWSDTGECHSYVNTQRTTGRIYKVTYGKPEPWKKDLAKCSDAELVALHKEQGKEWHIRQARRLLQERTHAGKEMDLQPLELVGSCSHRHCGPSSCFRRRCWYTHWNTSNSLPGSCDLDAMAHLSCNSEFSICSCPLQQIL